MSKRNAGLEAMEIINRNIVKGFNSSLATKKVTKKILPRSKLLVHVASLPDILQRNLVNKHSKISAFC
ncbi:hypothetical protein BpHYR1_019621 [Brachionus plicatilis]|uniref:Uncharacterized protein n=1 Tax=Brachionus plicatilis TaxID=10195 RepID=A0A3M7QF63_BRAPC|nr:hypothetical protein BpHYR1_019621 [Brachionus plicatilis]